MLTSNSRGVGLGMPGGFWDDSSATPKRLLATPKPPLATPNLFLATSTPFLATPKPSHPRVRLRMEQGGRRTEGQHPRKSAGKGMKEFCSWEFQFLLLIHVFHVLSRSWDGPAWIWGLQAGSRGNLAGDKGVYPGKKKSQKRGKSNNCRAALPRAANPGKLPGKSQFSITPAWSPCPWACGTSHSSSPA